MHIFFTVQSLFGEKARQRLYVKQRFFAVQINSPLPRFLLSFSLGLATSESEHSVTCNGFIRYLWRIGLLFSFYRRELVEWPAWSPTLWESWAGTSCVGAAPGKGEEKAVTREQPCHGEISKGRWRPYKWHGTSRATDHEKEILRSIWFHASH